MSLMFPRKALLARSASADGLLKRKDSASDQLARRLDPERTGQVKLDRLTAMLAESGIEKGCGVLKKELERLGVEPDDQSISWATLQHLIASGPETSLLRKTLTHQLAIPSFHQFCQDLVSIFESVRGDNEGETAQYIPELATVDPEKFAFCVVTVDGQVFSHGDQDDFCLQSCAKPFVYALACDELGIDNVHKWVGREPSGASFNAFTLNRDHKPHNPMINAGAFITHSLVKSELRASKRMAYLLNQMSVLAGDTKIGFDQPTYLSERETAYKNYALGYFMKSQGALPPEFDVQSDLEFYFQVCSAMVNCRTLAIMAATLAYGGRCPLTDRSVLSVESVKSTVQLLLSCGMYDYSGEWACTIGLPAKSGVSGAIFVVIPNVMGIAIWSPRLDAQGNSYRGIRFCEKLTARYSLSIFDQLMVDGSGKIDPTLPLVPRRRSSVDQQVEQPAKPTRRVSRLRSPMALRTMSRGTDGSRGEDSDADSDDAPAVQGALEDHAAEGNDEENVALTGREKPTAQA